MCHVVPVALGRGHECLDPPQLEPLLLVEHRAEQALLALEHVLHGLGIGHVERLQAGLEARDVQLQGGEEVLEQCAESSEGPRSSELEPVRDLVERHPGSELRGRQAPVPLEGGDVRNHEQERRGVRTRDGDVVLAEDVLREVAEDGPDLGPEQERGELSEHLLGEPARLRGCRLALGPLHGLGELRRGRLDDGLQPIDVGLDPLPPANRVDPGNVVRGLQARGRLDLKLGQADGFLEGPSIVVGGCRVLSAPRRRGDADLPGQLPVHRPGRGQQHALDLPEQGSIRPRVSRCERIRLRLARFVHADHCRWALRLGRPRGSFRASLEWGHVRPTVDPDHLGADRGR